jgi:predicted nuclease of predicted toxin-antitoxin system
MPLRFFADHCVANSVKTALTREGYDVFPLQDHLPTDAADPSVIAKAQELGAILLFLNGDFADIVNYPPERYKGIIALRVRNHPEITQLVVSRLKDFLSAHPDATFYEGKLLIVEPGRIKIRG